MNWDYKQAIKRCGARIGREDYLMFLIHPDVPAYTHAINDKPVVVFNSQWIDQSLFTQIMVHELGHVVLGHYKIKRSTVPDDVALAMELLCDKISEYGCNAIGAPFNGKATTYMAREATAETWQYVKERDGLARSAAQRIVDAGLQEGQHATVR